MSANLGNLEERSERQILRSRLGNPKPIAFIVSSLSTPTTRSTTHLDLRVVSTGDQVSSSRHGISTAARSENDSIVRFPGSSQVEAFIPTLHDPSR